MLKIVQERLAISQGDNRRMDCRVDGEKAKSPLLTAPGAIPVVGVSGLLRYTSTSPSDDECRQAIQRVADQHCDAQQSPFNAKPAAVVGAVAVCCNHSESLTAATEATQPLESSASWANRSEANTAAETLAIAAEVAPETLDLERSITERVRSEIIAEAMKNGGISSVSGFRSWSTATPVAEVIGSSASRSEARAKRRLLIKVIATCVVTLVVAIAISVGLVIRDHEESTFFPPDDTAIAHVPSTICYERIPMLGRSEVCSPQKQGSGVTQVVADSRLWSVPEAEIAILNAGEVRADLPKGNLTMGEAWELLPYYDNALVVIHLKGNKLVTALERGIQKLFDDKAASGESLNSTTPSGAYPYGAGIRWNVNMTRSFPHRLSDIEVNPRLGGAWDPIDLYKTYTIVTNSYLAAGGDSYHEFSSAEEQHESGLFSLAAFVAYCQASGLLVQPPLGNFSTQTYVHDSFLFEMN